MNENYAYIQFPSKSCNESFARSAVACFVAQLDPTLEELGDIKTAVSEGVTNAIVHGYPDQLGRIVVKMRIISQQTLEISIQDWGVGIANITQAKQPLFTTGDQERAGLGFTIMESFMDSMKVRSRPGKGTSILLRRKFPRRPSL